MTMTVDDLAEVGDLAKALGIVDGDGDFRSDWFTRPGDYLSGVLADETQRGALVAFIDEVLGGATRETDPQGLIWLPVVAVPTPLLTVYVVLDENPAGYVGVGVGARLTTLDPASSTQVHVPVFRAAKSGHSVASPLLLGTADAVVQLTTEITVDEAIPAPGAAALRAVAISVDVPTAAGPPPRFGLTLRGLQLPGTSQPSDLALDVSDLDELDDVVLNLIFGLVQAQADALAADTPLARLAALLGLRTDAGVPPLPFDRFATDGVTALADWAGDVLADDTARTAWLGQFAGLVDGTVTPDGEVSLGLGIARLLLGVRVQPGTGGRLTITPVLAAETDGATDVLLRAEADLFTVDLGAGAATALPRLSVFARFGRAPGGPGTVLLDVTNPVAVRAEALRAGVELDGARKPIFLLAADRVTISGNDYDVLDLTSPDALAEVAGTVLADVVADLLGLLGPAGTAVGVLLGFAPPPGHPAVPTIDLGLLLQNPVAAVAGYWTTLLDAHADAVPAVLATLRDLVADADRVAEDITGTGTADDPWRVPLAGPVDLVAWADPGPLLQVGVATGFAVDTLGGGCSLVETSVKVTVAEIDFAVPRVGFLAGVDAALTVRASGGNPARLGGDFFAITADRVGLTGTWTPSAGLRLGFIAPQLMVEVEDAPPFALPLPEIGADGSIEFPPEAWDAVEAFAAIVVRGAAPPWVAALLYALGWGVPPSPSRPYLRLADLVADPEAALRAWLASVRAASDPELFGVAFAVLTNLAGAPDGSGSLLLTGTGSPADPYLVSMADLAAAPKLAVWALPAGPCGPVSNAPDVLRAWRPGDPGLTPEALADGLRAEASCSVDVADLVSGRPDPAAGIAALVARWTGTDGRIAPPAADPPGVTVHTVDDAPYGTIPLDLAGLLGQDPQVTVHVAVVAPGASDTPPWGDAVPPERVVDLTAPGLAPESFSAPAAATGDWYVMLAPRADARLAADDPDGVAGQAARLRRVVDALADLGQPVTVVAYGAAGHAARRAGEEQPAVTALVTAGTPYGPIAFTVLDTDPGGDTLRLLHQLLPTVDDAEPDDPDLALGRALVDGLMVLAPLGDPAIELRLPAPPPGPPRAGLAVHAVFGTLTEEALQRAITAIVAAGLSVRAQQREAAAGPGAQEIRFGLRLPLPAPAATGTPPPIRVSGYADLDLAGMLLGDGVDIVSTTRALRVHAEVRSGQGWLLGGPDPGRTPGTPVDIELRWVEAELTVPLGGTDPGSAEIVLHEPRVFGIERERWIVRPVGTEVAGEIVTPALPEVRVLLSGAVARIAAATGDPVGGAFDAVLRALGIVGPQGGSVPDAIDHLLHDPLAHVGGVLGAAGTRQALVGGLRGLLAGTGTTPDELAFTIGPATVAADLAARSVGVDVAVATGGAVTYTGHAEVDATGHASFDVTFGPAVAASAAGALRVKVGAAPLAVALEWDRPGVTEPEEIALWPAPDVTALGTALARVVPAEAGRNFLELLRDLDPTATVIIDAALDAFGLLGPAYPDGSRRVVLPAAFVANPGAWFHEVLGELDPAHVIALLDALKPLLGVAGGPGEWQVTAGITIVAGGSGGNLTLGVTLDTGAFTAVGAGQLTAGGTAALAFVPGQAPRPTIDLFAGLADAPAGRSAVHLSVNGGVRLFLRPATGADVSLIPPGPGLGGLVTQVVTRALPLVLDAIAAQTGPGLKGDAGRLVAATGDALGLRTGPANARAFDADALQAFGADPAGALVHALVSGTALQAIATAFGPALPGGATASVVGTALRLEVGGTALTWTPAPFAVTVEGTVGDIPAVASVEFAVTLDVTGLGALVVQVGPAEVDAGGVILRPLLAAAVGTAPPGGRRVETGLGLDTDSALTARWLLDGGSQPFAIVFRDGTVEHTEPAQVALGLLDAVLDLVASFVIGTQAVDDLLGNAVGASTVRDLLEGVVLKPADPTQLDDDLFDPALLLTRLQRLAVNLAAADPSVDVGGGLTLGVRSTPVGGGNLLGLTLGLTDRIVVVPGDVTISLEADSTWITPAPPSAGIALDLLRVPTGQGAMTFQPGLTVNGVGVRITKASGPLLDTVLVIESLALHLYGEIGGGRPLSGGVQLELAGLAVAVAGAQGGNPVAQGIMGDAGTGNSALAPAFSPSLAVQKHGSGPVLVSLRAGEGAGPWWLAIQRGFGPLYIEQVGFGVTVEQDQIDRISVLFDGRVSIFGLTAAVDDLSLTYIVSSDASLFDPASWEVDLAGLAISSDLGGVLLQGGLRKFGTGDDVQYVGMLFARFGVYGLSVFGGYGESGPPGDRFASFFAFGAINGPIGGPPAFFVTGIGGGIGINRGLVIPADLSQFGTYPLIKALDPGAQPSPDPMDDLIEVGATFPVARDQFWFAAGVSFNSFALVDGVVVVSIAIGDGLQIALLGLARMALPRPQFALVSIELGLVARFSTKDAVLWVQAQLTDNSWLLYPEIRLTGGFAFVSWFGGPNAGQFVLTMGGYHPSFQRDGYPVVPRLGLEWRVASYLSIKGESYFALTSEAVMAGGRLEASATFGPAWASLVLGADAIIFFDPFFMSVTVYARISAGITIDVWIGEITISVSLGARVTVEGPQFHGSATFEVGPAELTIAFGDTNAPQPLPIGWTDFVSKYLEEASAGVARAVTAIPGRGAVPPGAGPGGATDTGTADGSVARPYEVICEFEITVTTTVPTRTFVIGSTPVDAQPSGQLGIAPMNIADAASQLTVRLENVTAFTGIPAGTDHIGELSRVINSTGAFPIGVWGPPQPAEDKKVPEGDVIEAAEGVTFTAAADTGNGSVPIVYNQVKVRTRLPLPFVNSRAARPRVLADAGSLHGLVPSIDNAAELLEVSQDWLGNAGYGRTTLASFVGERAAPPLLGTLAEGLTGAEIEAQPAYPDTVVTPPVDTTVHAPRAIAVFAAALDTPETAALRTTVTGDAQTARMAPPTIEGVRAAAELAVPAQLLRVAPRAGTDQSTLLARGASPLTRQARTGAEASAVRGSAPDGAARLDALTDALGGGRNGARAADRPAADVVHAGEIAVLRLPNAGRDVVLNGPRPLLTLDGCPARTLVLGHGGDVLTDTTEPKIQVLRGAERVVVAALGDQADEQARLTGLVGWHAGLALGYTGWSAALAPGAIVRCQGRYGRRGLARVRTGWVQAAELVAGTGLVETRFAEPVDVVVIAIDDPAAVGVDPGGQGGRGLAMGLSGARRVRRADGGEEPPTVVVNQGRGYTVYAVEPRPGEFGKSVVVTVASEDGWHLVGVLGGRGDVATIADRLATAGIGDLMRPFAPGQGGAVRLSWSAAG
ncbi:MAG TPA: DUF6603 domain-containing protein [Streptosporangiaceae bacterium]